MKSSLDVLLELCEVMQRSRLIRAQADTRIEIPGSEEETRLGYGKVESTVLGERRWRYTMGLERAQTSGETFRVGANNRLQLATVLIISQDSQADMGWWDSALQPHRLPGI